MLRSLILAAVAFAFGASGSAATSGPTIAQIKVAIAKHSDNFVLANAYASNGRAVAHGWLNLKDGGGRWVSPNGKVVTIESVTPDPNDPALSDVATTTINYTAKTWTLTKRQEPTNFAHSRVIDPLVTGQPGVQFRLVGVENVDGRQTYHFRSTYFPWIAESARADVWLSTDQDYFIRGTHTTRAGKVIQRVDNHWLPRTPANLALLTTAIPSGFKQVSASS
ncbi:MAG TPA: hypothetical protein VG652_09875 [Gaiellaceae bacterium]|nr:hypothetical protein [Gaiellaceae bacterium]